MKTQSIIKQHKLVTVCEEAKCPNIGECWSNNTATFMIMGDLCTRRCSFCSVKDGSITNLNPLNPLEPFHVATAVKKLGLKHVVITSVNRDDLEDMGAEHFYNTAKAISYHSPSCKIELLIPDMQGKRSLLEVILQDNFVSVLNHNVETVPRLYRTVRPGSYFKRSLDILALAKDIHPSVKTKSGIMVGLGERLSEILEVMDRLREINCDILTIGQYLQPTRKQLPVVRYITPDEFEEYRIEGLKRGFSYVESGPFVRSSYHAWKHTSEIEPFKMTAP
jgi:lipoyl synthase